MLAIDSSFRGCCSRMCESKVRSSFGRRFGRLGWPSPGYRNLVAGADRIWNKVHSCVWNGGCTVSTHFFPFLQGPARRIALVDRYMDASKVGEGCRYKVFDKVVDVAWVMFWYEGEGSGLPAVKFCRLKGFGSEWQLEMDNGKWLGTKGRLIRERTEGSRTFRRGDEGQRLKVSKMGKERLRGYEPKGKIWRKGDGDLGNMSKVDMEEIGVGRQRSGRLKTITCQAGEDVEHEWCKADTCGQRQGIRWAVEETFPDKSEWDNLDGLELLWGRPKNVTDRWCFGPESWNNPKAKGYGLIGSYNWVVGDSLCRQVGSAPMVDEWVLAPNGLDNITRGGLLLVVQWDKRKREGPHRCRRENFERGERLIKVEGDFAWDLSQSLRNISGKREEGCDTGGGPGNGELYIVRLVRVWNVRWGEDLRGNIRVGFSLGNTTHRRIAIFKWSYQEYMAEEVAKQMENLKFSEEELTDVGDGEMLLHGNGEDTDMGRQGAPKKKLGIVYKGVTGKTEALMSKEGGAENRMQEIGKETTRNDRGKMEMSGGSRIRGAKRSLQGKNEVCNPFTTKRSRQGFTSGGAEEDEVSEVTSPIKNIPAVEAASQPRREP
ncbi:hypothetical protein V6N13_116969 [Hibiscus sabdariffa]